MDCDQSQPANYFKTREIKIRIKPESLSAEKFPYIG